MFVVTVKVLFLDGDGSLWYLSRGHFFQEIVSGKPMWHIITPSYPVLQSPIQFASCYGAAYFVSSRYHYQKHFSCLYLEHRLVKARYCTLNYTCRLKDLNFGSLTFGFFNSGPPGPILKLSGK